MGTEVNKLKNIKEFTKLFKVPIPYENEFVYYIETLIKSMEFWNLYHTIVNFNKYEDWIKKSEYENPAHYKMKYAMPKAIEYIRQSKTYEKFLEVDYTQEKFYTKDLLKMNEGKIMISFDLVSANFSTMGIFDSKGIGSEFGASWKELCEHLDIHPVLASSKSFRQVVFGNINPKRNQKLQHMKMVKLADAVIEKFGEDRVVFISHDEIVVLPERPEIDFMTCSRIDEVLRTVDGLWTEIIDNTPLKSTIFTMDRIQKGVYVKEIFEIEKRPTLCYLTNKQGFVAPNNKVKTLQSVHKSLFGAPSNQYFKLFKEHIINESIEERDLYFMNDNKLAKWVVDK